MSSSDEEDTYTVLGASSSKDHAPVTPLGSESESDDAVKKRARKYKRPRNNWERVLLITKGADTEMDDDKRKAQMTQEALAFMKAGKIYKLTGHKSGPSDFGLWKLLRKWPADDGATRLCVYKCPLSGQALQVMLKRRLLIVIHINC